MATPELIHQNLEHELNRGFSPEISGFTKKPDELKDESLYTSDEQIDDYLDNLRRKNTSDNIKKIDTLGSSIRNSSSVEEAKAYLDQAHTGKWVLPEDEEIAKGMLTPSTVVSTGPDGRKYVGALIGDSDYNHLISILERERSHSETKTENDSSWVPRLRSVIKRVNDLSDSIIGRKNKNELVIELTGADRKEAARALKGHLPEEELHKFEDLIGNLPEDKDADVITIPLKKNSTVIEFPTVKKEVKISGESLKDSLEEKFGNKESSSPLAEEMLADREKDTDGKNATKAKSLFSAGNIEGSLSGVETIQDEEMLANVVRDIVIDCVNDKDFQNARRFISKIKDDEYRKELGEWLQSQVKVSGINIRREKGEFKYNRGIDQSYKTEESLAPKEEKKPEEAKLEVDETFDLPLKSEVETVEPAVDLDLNSPKSSPVSEEAPKPETLETVDLEKARDEYAKQYAEYKNKVRSKRGWFAKHLADLGFDKQLPESEKPDELKDAERTYIEAKKKKNESLFSATVKRKKSVSGQIFDLREVEYDFNPAILEETEKEFSALQEKIQEGLSPQEKSAIARALDAWPNMGKWQRRFLSTAMLTAGNVVFGTLTIPAAASYAGYRLGRSVAGAGVAQGAGLGVEKYFKNKNEKDREGIEDEYSMELNEGNFEEREKEIMQKLEGEIDKKKRQRLVKAGVMAGVGGLAAYGIGSSKEHILASNAGLHTDMPETPERPIGIKDMVKDLPQKDLPGLVHSVEVPVSSKGFIETIHNLKEDVIKQYGNIDNVPAEIKKNILDYSDVELAKKLHMYDPGNNLSGVGYKGETLGLDSSGNIVYHHLDGKSDILLDTKTGLTQHFSGPMSGADALTDASNTQVVPPIDFEGGKIYVLKDLTSPNTVKVLLDGKEIGKGVVDNGIPKIKIDSSLKSGWFMVDNVYERAFKVAKSTIKNSKITV